ncbi:MAG: hypothetical protein ACRCYU_10835 [Nocardioides sp.]
MVTATHRAVSPDDTVVGRIDTIHTLGPAGTNLERAAHYWFAQAGRPGTVELHDEVEDGLDRMSYDGAQAILACAVYPRLHDLVFQNLHRLVMVDSFILDTYNMVLAAHNPKRTVRTVVSHPAPSALVSSFEVSLTSSNSRAARQCADGHFDACLTTEKAAVEANLVITRDFGPVPMVFTVHLGVSR